MTDTGKKGLHIPSLDGIRALSFLLVFVAHSGLHQIVPGGFGVTTFFFLSGFLITTLMRIEWERTGTVSLKNFYLRRVLRILPPFYTVLVAATVLAALRVVPVAGEVPGGSLELRPVLAQFLHYTNYYGIFRSFRGMAEGTDVYWSLAVEEHFYLLFPLIYLTTRRLGMSGRAQGFMFAALCLAGCIWRCLLVLKFDVPADRTYMGSDTRFDSIFFGCGLAVAMNPVLDEVPGSEPLWKHLLFPAGLVLLVFTFGYRAPWFRETIRYTLQGVGLIPLFVVAIKYPAWGPMPFLSNNWLAYIGLLSYSLYLIHQVVLITLRHHFPGLGAVLISAAGLAISVLASTGIHRGIEKPAARLRKRLEIG